MYLLVVKDERRVIKKKGTLRIVPNPITDANTGVEHKTLGGKVRDAGLPKSMAELGTAWLFRYIMKCGFFQTKIQFGRPN